MDENVFGDSRLQDWWEARQYTPEMMEQARQVLEEMRAGAQLQVALKHHSSPEGGYLAKHVLVAAYRELTESGKWQPPRLRRERPGG